MQVLEVIQHFLVAYLGMQLLDVLLWALRLKFKHLVEKEKPGHEKNMNPAPPTKTSAPTPVVAPPTPVKPPVVAPTTVKDELPVLPPLPTPSNYIYTMFELSLVERVKLLGKYQAVIEENSLLKMNITSLMDNDEKQMLKEDLEEMERKMTSEETKIKLAQTEFVKQIMKQLEETVKTEKKMEEEVVVAMKPPGQKTPVEPLKEGVRKVTFVRAPEDGEKDVQKCSKQGVSLQEVLKYMIDLNNKSGNKNGLQMKMTLARNDKETSEEPARLAQKTTQTNTASSATSSQVPPVPAHKSRDEDNEPSRASTPETIVSVSQKPTSSYDRHFQELRDIKNSLKIRLGQTPEQSESQQLPKPQATTLMPWSVGYAPSTMDDNQTVRTSVSSAVTEKSEEEEVEDESSGDEYSEECSHVTMSSGQDEPIEPLDYESDAYYGNEENCSEGDFDAMLASSNSSILSGPGRRLIGAGC